MTDVPRKRFITMWRKPSPNVLDWDNHVSESVDEVHRVIVNIKKNGVHQFATYELGDKLPDLSSAY